MKTVVLDAAQAGAILRAIDILRTSWVVALPTETVYGLAGDALNPLAAARIFEAKNRPRLDPLIIHVVDREMLDQVADISGPDAELIEHLIQKYWPGPLTLILPKRDSVPDLVTSGSPLVAVRMPAHPIFQAVLQEFGNPLAAPSANPFGRISPTTAEHVRMGLNGKIPLILDGGNCRHGLESTIIYPLDDKLHVLRAGPITLEELAEIAPVEDRNQAGKKSAPGQLESHYAPRKPLRLVDSAVEVPDPPNAGFLAFSESPHGFGAVEILTQTRDMTEAAANLFAALHRLDVAPVSRIYAERIPDEGLGRALMDRLTRAAAP